MISRSEWFTAYLTAAVFGNGLCFAFLSLRLFGLLDLLAELRSCLKQVMEHNTCEARQVKAQAHARVKPCLAVSLCVLQARQPKEMQLCSCLQLHRQLHQESIERKFRGMQPTDDCFLCYRLLPNNGSSTCLDLAHRRRPLLPMWRGAPTTRSACRTRQRCITMAQSCAPKTSDTAWYLNGPRPNHLSKLRHLRLSHLSGTAPSRTLHALFSNALARNGNTRMIAFGSW